MFVLELFRIVQQSLCVGELIISPSWIGRGASYELILFASLLLMSRPI
jgi:hypothetical protein